MDYSYPMEFSTKNTAGKLSSDRISIENGNSDKGLASLKQGQQITGTVVSVEEQVTLNFNGQKVIASKSVLSNVQPGEMKTFEVVKATDTEIELKLLDGDKSSRKPFTAAMIKDSDWETILAQKGKTSQKAGKEAKYLETKTQLEAIGAKFTEADYKALEEEGFPIESFTVGGLYSALNRIKAEISRQQTSGGAVINGGEKTSNITKEELIAKRLKDTNLPVTEENIARITKALDLSGTVSKIDDKAMRYLISGDVKPSVENIYKAYYSGPVQKTQKLSEQEWSDLQAQVEDVIKSAGYEVTNENLGDARWLIENKLPLTTESFTFKKDLEDLKVSSDNDTVMNTLLEGMKNGTNPMEVSLFTVNSTSAAQVVANVQAIRPETVTAAIRTGTELTIRNLISLQENSPIESKSTEAISAETDTDDTDFSERETDAGASDSTYEEVHARRQLEEIRLKMTFEAANALEKKGIKVETRELSKVVEALKELEDDYYKQYLKEADAKATDTSLRIFKETTGSIEQLKYIPSYILGSTLSERNTQTIPGLLQEGLQLQAKLDKAGTAYETLMTVPNSEYGDSIKKAFAHMDSLLSEMNIENSVENQRAVRILGYNQMEITEESINQVKAYDLEVTTMVKNLHPEVTVRMIRDGINPLEMPIDELNRTIDKIKDEQGITSEEKYSTYLRQLEKSDQITAEERKAYIGVYRLLYNIEKSDGAALGAVVKAGQEITLDHLLTAVQTSKKGRLDAVVNDEFGTLQSLTRAKESIAQQLSGFTSDGGQQNESHSSQEDVLARQTQYLERILKQVKEELTPDKLKEAGQNTSLTSAAQSVLPQAPSALQTASTQQSIWEAIKNVPVEKLLNNLQNANSQPLSEDEKYTQKVQEIRELCKTAEQAIRFLDDYQIPSSPVNIMMTNQVLSNQESPIKRLLRLQEENFVEKSENSLKEMNDLSDTLIDKHSMEEVFAQLETDANAALNQSYSEEKIDTWKLAELKNIGQQMTFIKTLAEKEYYQIPVETNNGVTNMNLTILRGTKDSGKVSVTIRSEKLGNVKADFSLKDRTLKGLITSDSRSGLEQLQKNAGQINEAAAESEVNLKQLDFSYQKRDTDTYSYQNPNLGENASTMKAETERTLYRLAKAIVRTVRSAEGSRSEEDQAVS